MGPNTHKNNKIIDNKWSLKIVQYSCIISSTQCNGQLSLVNVEFPEWALNAKEVSMSLGLARSFCLVCLVLTKRHQPSPLFHCLLLCNEKYWQSYYDTFVSEQEFFDCYLWPSNRQLALLKCHWCLHIQLGESMAIISGDLGNTALIIFKYSHQATSVPRSSCRADKSPALCTFVLCLIFSFCIPWPMINLYTLVPVINLHTLTND